MQKMAKLFFLNIQKNIRPENIRVGFQIQIYVNELILTQIFAVKLN
jgi:hypothetical protein